MTKRDQIESLITLWARGDSSRTAADLTDGIRAILAEPSDTMLREGCGAALATSVLMDDRRFACERACWDAMLTAAWRAPA